jgi:hypothetical protein
MYRLQPRFHVKEKPHPGWQDILITELGTGLDATQIVESLKLTPTERLESMRRAAASLEGLSSRT